MTGELPLVSCIMPTRDRPAFVRRSIDLFLAQDYPNKQLVIVYEGVKADLPQDRIYITERIVDLTSKPGLSIGAKRNIACEHAAGELIAHWDDDDWHSPKRLSTQVRTLREQGARLCGADRLVFYDERAERAWLFQSTRPSGQPWLAGGTLVYERSLWLEQPFAEVSNGEDTAFVDAAYRRGVRTARVTDPSLYVAILHGGNTTTRDVSSQWGGFDVRTVKQWMTGGERRGGVDARA